MEIIRFKEKLYPDAAKEMIYIDMLNSLYVDSRVLDNIDDLMFYLDRKLVFFIPPSDRQEYMENYFMLENYNHPIEECFYVFGPDADRVGGVLNFLNSNINRIRGADFVSIPFKKWGLTMNSYAAAEMAIQDRNQKLNLMASA